MPPTVSGNPSNRVGVRVHVSNDDFERVFSGDPVTKVVFLPNDQHGVSPAYLETLISSNMAPETDVLAEAKRRGQPVVSFELIPRSPSAHFETPDALMMYAVDCQMRGDTAGWIACLTDIPVRRLASSCVMTGALLLHQLESNSDASRSANSVKQAKELRRLINEELGNKEAEATLAAMVLASKEITKRTASDPEDTANASSDNPLIQMLSTAAAERLQDPRRFVVRFAVLGNVGVKAIEV